MTLNICVHVWLIHHHFWGLWAPWGLECVLYIFVFHRTYDSVWHIVSTNKCLLRGACLHLQSTHTCCNLGPDFIMSGLLQSSAAHLWLLQSPLNWFSLFLLCPRAICFSQSGCSDLCETEVRPCHGSTQNLAAASHLTQTVSLSLHRHMRPYRTWPCTASSTSAPNILPSPTELWPQQPPDSSSITSYQEVLCLLFAWIPCFRYLHRCSFTSCRSNLKHELIKETASPNSL